MNIDISKLSLTELKAAAYDIIAHIEQDQRNLATINQAIAAKQGGQAPTPNALMQAIKSEE